MKRRLASWGTAAVAALAVLGTHPARLLAQGGAVPIYDEPHHRLVYRNALVRVYDVRVAAGDSSGYHVHAYPLVGVRIREARNWEQVLGAARGPIEAPGPVPAPLDNWNRALPYTHRVGNSDTTGFQYVVAEVLRPAGVACPALAQTSERRLVNEGKAARVYEIHLPPHASEAAHRHACPGLTVLGTNGTLEEEGTKLTAAGGAGAGRWEWRGAGHRHVLRNPGDTPLIVYEIDWR